MSNRRKLLQVSTELLFNLLRGEHPNGYRVIGDDVPEDANLVNVRHAWPNSIEILIESESFPELGNGEPIPYLTPVCETITHEPVSQ